MSAHSQDRPPTSDDLSTQSFLERLRSGDRQAVERAIQYLEEDPWMHRSGYLKERLIRGLKRATRTHRDDIRLQRVVWNVANGPFRREFRDYCSLAAAVATKEFLRWISEIDALEGNALRLQQFLAKHGSAR